MVRLTINAGKPNSHGRFPLVICHTAIGNGHRNCVSFPTKNGVSVHSFVSLPGGILSDHLTFREIIVLIVFIFGVKGNRVI